MSNDDRILVDSIKTEIRKHVESALAGGEPFYGYAILPGEPYRVGSLVAAFNRESDVDSANAGDPYYRYSVDEWAHYQPNAFPETDRLIEARNEQFDRQHVKQDPADFGMDESQKEHVAALHAAILTGLGELKVEGVFDSHSFVVIWIPDSEHPMMYRSARELNSEAVYDVFMEAFG